MVKAETERTRIERFISSAEGLLSKRIVPGKGSKLVSNTVLEGQLASLKLQLSRLPKPILIPVTKLSMRTMGPEAIPKVTERPKMEPLAKGVGTSTPQKGLSNTQKALIVGGVGLILFG